MQIHFRLSWPGTLWTALSRQWSQNLGSFSHETPLSLSLFCSVVWWERVRILNGVATVKNSMAVPKKIKCRNTFSSVQSLSRVQLFATPWTAAHQASLSITNSRSSLRLTSIELVMPSSHLILGRPLLLKPPIPPSIRVFPMSQLFAWGGQSIGVSASASVLPMNTQDLSRLGWTGWTSLQSKGLSRVFSNTTVQKHQFFSTQPSSQSNSHIHTWPLEKP